MTKNTKYENITLITADSEWLDFKQKCLQGCSRLQIDEMGKAFFAGILSANNVMCNIPEDFTEAQHMKVFDDMFVRAQAHLDISKK